MVDSTIALLPPLKEVDDAEMIILRGVPDEDTLAAVIACAPIRIAADLSEASEVTIARIIKTLEENGFRDLKRRHHHASTARISIVAHKETLTVECER